MKIKSQKIQSNVAQISPAFYEQSRFSFFSSIFPELISSSFLDFIKIRIVFTSHISHTSSESFQTKLTDLTLLLPLAKVA